MPTAMTDLWIEEEIRIEVERMGLRRVRDAWREDLAAEVVNDRGERQVLRIRLPESGRVIYLKRWRFSLENPRRFLPFQDETRLRARNEYRNLLKLALWGFKVPPTLLVGEEAGLWGPKATLLGVENLAGYECCADWGREHPEARGAIVRGVAALLARLHYRGIFHRSPGLKHFYLRPESLDEPFALLDVPRLDRQPETIPRLLAELVGWEIPGPERDLSKALLGIEDEFGSDSEIGPVFFAEYFKNRTLPLDPEKVRRRILQDIERRRESRLARR